MPLLEINGLGKTYGEGDNATHAIGDVSFSLQTLGAAGRLRGVLAVGSHDRATVITAVADAARAAHSLHEAGIVHRDINPDNVLLAADGGRLADLGLAQVLQPGVAVTGIGRVESVEYIDPVVLGGGQPSRLTDVYGLGMTLHRALSGIGMSPSAAFTFGTLMPTVT